MHIRHQSPVLRAKVLFVALCLAGASTLGAQSREQIQPGWNLFSKQQDIELGKEASTEVEKEVQVVDDKQLNDYVNRIGQKLAKVSQDPEYPFTFTVIADKGINAFALPGGPIYINSGTIAAADNEAQLAGVIGHEIGHVVLRHSTNQASKQSLFQLPAMLASGVLGQGGGMLGQLAQIGLGFGLNSAMLSYSRKAETQADIVGTRELLAAGYNPIEMANFFQKLEESGGAQGPQFLSSHPNPGNRVKNVTAELAGYPKGNYVTNTAEFPKMKARAAKIEPKQDSQAAPASNQQAPPNKGVATTNGVWSASGYKFLHPTTWTLIPPKATPSRFCPPTAPSAVRTARPESRAGSWRATSTRETA